jgi:hypothetical protein
MLPLPVLDGGICSTRRLSSIACTENLGKTPAQLSLGSRSGC